MADEPNIVVSPRVIWSAGLVSVLSFIAIVLLDDNNAFKGAAMLTLFASTIFVGSVVTKRAWAGVLIAVGVMLLTTLV